MKKLVITLTVFCLSLGMMAQDDYQLFRLVYIKAKPGHVQEFEKKLAEHNKKFHNEGAMSVTIDAIMNGRHMGEYGWVQGPMTFSDMDNMGKDEAHDIHWDEEVMPLVASVRDAGFWRSSEKMSYWPENFQGAGKTTVTYFDLVRGKEKLFYDLFEDVLKVYREKKYENPLFLTSSQFQTGDRKDVAVVTMFEKFSYFDKDNTFVKDFEEIHGPGSWHGFMNDFLESTNSEIDELRVQRKDLGGVE